MRKMVNISEAFSPEGFKKVKVGNVYTFNFNAWTNKEEKTSYRVKHKLNNLKILWAEEAHLMTEDEFAEKLGVSKDNIEAEKQFREDEKQIKKLKKFLDDKEPDKV